MRCSRGGQPRHELGFQRCVGVPFGQGGNDVLHFRGVPVVQLRDDMEELGFLAADTGQGELCLGLGEPHGRPLGPEWREPYGHS
jgi:hypothetical protein